MAAERAIKLITGWTCPCVMPVPAHGVDVLMQNRLLCAVLCPLITRLDARQCCDMLGSDSQRAVAAPPLAVTAYHV